MHRLTQNDAAGADASANNTTAESEEDEKLLKRLSEMLLDPGIFHTDKSDEPISNLCVEFFNIYFRTMSFFIIPILLLPLIILDYDSKPFKFFYVILIMSLFWTIKPIPPQVTALIPITMFPIFGIMKSEVVCGLYLSSENITSIAGMILGIAIEYSGIHKRLALQTVSMIGWNIRRLHSSIMLITAFLSFWVPNVAATSIMCPVVTAILDECKRHGLISSEELFEESKISKPKAVRRSKTKICFYIGLSYASSIGGMSTLTGTSQNLTMKNIYDRIFSKTQQPDPVGFAQWFLFMLIPVVVLLFATIVWLQFIYLGLFRYSMERNAEEEELIHAVVAMKLKVMGKVTPHEIITCLLFILGIFLCCFRTAGFQGWAELLYPDNPNFILESAPLIGIVILMFIIPQTCECFQYCRTGVARDSYPRDPTDPVLTWKYTHHKFPWQLIFFMGAGYAIAGGATESGAAKWLESKLTILDVVPNFAILMMVFFFTIMLSNFMTGGAISNVVLPLLLQMAVVKKIHPFYLMIPCGIASSLTFLTQIGTPTNAYVATYGNIPSYDLLFSGLFPTLFSIVLFPFIFIFWGKFIFPVIFQDFNT